MHPAGRLDWFAAQFDGVLQVREEGGYDFRVTVAEDDDAAVLRLGEDILIERPAEVGDLAVEQSVFLEFGQHRIDLRYLEQRGQQGLKLEFRGPDTDNDWAVLDDRFVVQEFDPFYDTAPPAGLRVKHRALAFPPAGALDGLDDGPLLAVAEPARLDLSPLLDDPLIPGATPDDVLATATGTLVGTQPGVYVFEIEAFGAVDFQIDGGSVFASDGVDGAVARTSIVPVDLEAGDHAFRILNHSRAGDEQLRVSYCGTDTDGFRLVLRDDPVSLAPGEPIDDLRARFYELPAQVDRLDQSDFGPDPTHEEAIERIFFRNSPSIRFYDDIPRDNVVDTFGNGEDALGTEGVVGSRFDDVIEGAAADESFVGGDGEDTIIGGDGGDVVDYGRETGGGGVVVELHLRAAIDSFGDRDVLRQIEDAVGTYQADDLVGDLNDNLLAGGAGDDVLIGRAGDNLLSGSAGRDLVDYSRNGGSAGVVADLRASSGNVVDTHGDRDTLISIERLRGSAQADSIVGADGDEELEGLGGDDTLQGGDGEDLIDGGDGADRLVGGLGDDELRPGSGLDVVSTGGGADCVAGLVDEPDGDRIADFDDEDALVFEGVVFARDALTVTPGSAILGVDVDGDGTEHAVVTLEGDYANARFTVAAENGATVIRVADNAAPAPVDDRVSVVEDRRVDGNVLANDVDDQPPTVLSVDGDAAGVGAAVAGTFGTLTLGIDGGFSYVADRADDLVGGDLVQDSFVYVVGDGLAQSQATLTVDVAGADEIRRGDKSRNVLEGGAGPDLLVGRGGDDLLRGRGRGDEMRGDVGDDDLFGQAGADLMRGGARSDDLFGGDGADRMFGGNGGDLLVGAAGRDRAFGGAGADVLDGGRGSDRLQGGGGRDEFRVSRGDGRDLVLDWQDGRNATRVEAGAASFGALDIRQKGRDVLVEYGRKGDVLVLRAADADALDAADFVFG